MGLFSFGTPTDLPAPKMKKVMDRLHADVKAANGKLPSLHHAVAAALGSCGYKCLPDSKLVESAIREIRTYGMPDGGRNGIAAADWWMVTAPEARVAAIESTAKCLQ